MFKKLLIILLFSSTLSAQHIPDEYISFALQNNSALKQADFSYEQSVAALKEARGMFLPAVSLQARYTRSEGGRTIDFPIGDMLNPIYQTLNVLTNVPAFPTNIPNEQINFMREREHETKVRVVQPLFQPKIYYNYKIHKKMRDIQQASRQAFARQLVADVKTAYFNYLTAQQAVALTNRTHALLEENLRVSESLAKNGKVTQDIIYRAQAELGKLERQQAETGKMMTLAKSYFNFLLNRPLDKAINSIDSAERPHIVTPAETDARALALQNREELAQMDAAIAAQQNGIQLQYSDFLPGVVLVFDYGYQGKDYNFTDEYDYWMGSAVLSWNLLNGGQDKAKIQQAKLEKARLQEQKRMLMQKIELDVQSAFESVRVARESINAAEKTLTAAKKNYELVSKKWQQGMVPHIEYLDAQNTFTHAEMNAMIVKYDLYIQQAELEKAAALYELPQTR